MAERKQDKEHEQTPRAAALLSQQEGVHALETGWGGDESATNTRRMRSMVEAREQARKVKLQIQKERAEEALHVTAVKIQSMWRMFACYRSVLLTKVRERREERRRQASIKIQKVFRGHVARGNVGLEIVIEFRKKENSAAALVQSVFRGHLARSLADLLRQRRDADLDLARSKRAQALIRGARTRSRVWMVWNFLRHKVRTIERFCQQRFQPWQREQVELLNENLNKVVRIQALARRYLAYKRAREMRAAKKFFLSMGLRMVFFLVMMTLFLSFTINERSNGTFNDLLFATKRRFASDITQQSHVPLFHIRHPAMVWIWLNSTLSVYNFLEQTSSCDVQVRNDRKCTNKSSFELGIPAMVVSSVAVGQKRSKRYKHTMPWQSGNRSAVVSSSPYNVFNRDKSTYGSVYLPFSFDSSASLGALQGSFSEYLSGFFKLDDPLLGNSTFLDCGIPQVGGICRYQTGRWLDSNTRALVLGFAIASPSMNALVTARFLLELPVGGGIVPSLHTSASRLQARRTIVLALLTSLQVFGGSQKPWGGVWEGAVRVFPEVLFLLLGASWAVSSLVSSVFSITISFKPNRFFSLDKLEIRRSQLSLIEVCMQPFKSIDSLLLFLLVLVTFLWVLLQLSAQMVSAELIARKGSKSAGAMAGVASFLHAQLLVDLHDWGDTFIAVVAMLMWQRLLFSYLSTMRRCRTSILSIRRLVVPLAALLITAGTMAMGLAHVAQLSFGRNLKGFETIDSVLFTIVQAVVAVVEEEPSTRPAGFGRFGRTSRLSQQESDSFMIVVFLFALCVLGIAIATTIVAYAEEADMTTGILNRPWLYEGSMRTAIYSDWELPPLSEVKQATVEAFKSRVEEQVMLKKAAIQARVLSHIRADSLRVQDVNAFKWALEVDKTRDLDRKTAKYFMKTSRALAYQLRHYNQRIMQMESLFLLTSFRLNELIEHFVRLDLPSRKFHWPHARLSSDETDKARDLIARKKEEEGKKIVKIPFKMLGAIERQCETLKKVMAQVISLVPDTNSGHADETESNPAEQAAK